MKKSFITGLAIILPLIMTVALLIFTVNLLTRPFINGIEEFLSQMDILSRGFLFLSHEQVLHYLSKMLILLLLFSVTILLGFLTRWVVVHSFLNIGSRILHKIPLFNRIYKTSQDVVQTLMKPDSRAFKQVVLVPFPQPGALTLGLLTQVEGGGDAKTAKGKRLTVFVPATPNPTMGYLVVYRREQITFLDMKVDEALKTIVSCGLIFPEIHKRVAHD